MKADLSFAAVDRLLSLDSFGVLRWKQTRGGGAAEGDVAGTTNKHGYVCVGVCRSRYFAHRIVWLLHYREWPAGLIDHINGVRHDNRIENLRVVDHFQNATNCGGVRGVTLHSCGKYQAQIKHNKRNHYLGLHATEAEAVAAYFAASKRLHGEYGARP